MPTDALSSRGELEKRCFPVRRRKTVFSCSRSSAHVSAKLSSAYGPRAGKWSASIRCAKALRRCFCAWPRPGRSQNNEERAPHCRQPPSRPALDPVDHVRLRALHEFHDGRRRPPLELRRCALLRRAADVVCRAVRNVSLDLGREYRHAYTTPSFHSFQG